MAEKTPLSQMNDTQREVLDTLAESYTRYNKLVERIIDVVNENHSSIYSVKKAVLNTLSESLHKG